VENKGIFPFNLLNKIRDPICERIARVVQRPCYMSIITPLIIPSKSPLITIKNNKTKLHFYKLQILQYKKETSRKIFFLPDINNCNIWKAPKRQKLRPCYVWYATRHGLLQTPHFFFLCLSAGAIEQRDQESWGKMALCFIAHVKLCVVHY